MSNLPYNKWAGAFRARFLCNYIVTIQDRSKRYRIDRMKMIQECKNPIVENDSHGFLHHNCEGTEQLHYIYYYGLSWENLSQL